MTSTRRLAVPTLLISGLLVGCGTSRDAEFADVQNQVSDRGGPQVQWIQDSDADHQAQASVRDLLSKGLTPDTAVQIALLNNRDLQATYEDLGIAQADLVQAGLLRNPIFSAAVKFGKDGGVFPEFSVVEDFFSILYIPLRKRVAAAEFEATKLRVSGHVFGVIMSTRTAFIELQTAEQMVELLQHVTKATDAAADLAQRLFVAGNIPEVEAATQWTFHHQALLELSAAETQARLARERVNVMMGLWGTDTGWTVDGRLPDPPKDEMALDDLEKQAVARNLDLAATRQEIAALSERLGIVNPFSPDQALEAGVGATKDPSDGWLIGPQASVGIPIFDTGSAFRARLRSQLRQAQQRFIAQAVNVRAAVRGGRDRLLGARDRAIFLRDIALPKQKRLLDLTQDQYNGMLISAFRLLQVKQREIDTAKQYVLSLEEYWAARATLGQVLVAGSGGMSAMPMLGSMSMSSSSSSSEGH